MQLGKRVTWHEGCETMKHSEDYKTASTSFCHPLCHFVTLCHTLARVASSLWSVICGIEILYINK